VSILRRLWTRSGTHTQLVGKMLFTKYVLPFEIASILLFAAIVGAIVLAKKQIIKEEK